MNKKLIILAIIPIGLIALGGALIDPIVKEMDIKQTLGLISLILGVFLEGANLLIAFDYLKTGGKK